MVKVLPEHHENLVRVEGVDHGGATDDSGGDESRYGRTRDEYYRIVASRDRFVGTVDRPFTEIQCFCRCAADRLYHEIQRPLLRVNAAIALRRLEICGAYPERFDHRPFGRSGGVDHYQGAFAVAGRPRDLQAQEDREIALQRVVRHHTLPHASSSLSLTAQTCSIRERCFSIHFSGRSIVLFAGGRL